MDNGQSILVSKLFDDQNYTPKTDEPNEVDTLLQLATDKLKPMTLENLKNLSDKRNWQKNNLK
ncbi:MAG TPA: hypothetical protein VFR70_04695 [Flavobacterium sp.]|nr:hypothetical protein [Flavobacterium sp.]